MSASTEPTEPTERSRPEAGRATWVGSLLAAAVGLAFAVAVERATTLEVELRDASLRDAAMGPLWVLAGLYVLLGVATVVVVRSARRWPWLPTTAAALLTCGLLATVPGPLANVLPYLGAWAPSAHQGQSVIALVAGAMLATAVWAWWPHRQAR